MSALLTALPALYPCSHCANDLGVVIADNPPDVSSGKALSAWLCQVHNGVNDKLGKPLFDCTKVYERWKDGWSDGRCD